MEAWPTWRYRSLTVTAIVVARSQAFSQAFDYRRAVSNPPLGIEPEDLPYVATLFFRQRSDCVSRVTDFFTGF